MAGKIRGITIELNGDTKGLVTSLNNAKKSVKGVQMQLKDVNKVLKLDPTSTTLLTQKQDLLKKQVDETDKALQEQKQALKDLQSADDSDKTIDAQNALQREITETEAALKKAETELRNFGTVGTQQAAAVGEKMKEVGQSVADVGDSMTKYVTGPIVAVGTASVVAFKSVDEGLDIIKAKTGATGEEFAGMESIFKNIATTIPADMATIGNAVGEVNTRFGSTGEELESLSTQFIQFSALTGQDVTTAIDQTQKALAAYGLTADDAGGYLDLMNKVSQETGVSVDKLQSGIISNGAAFQEMGLSIEQSTIFMGQLEKSGANSETVLNGMRKALKNATKEGIPLDQALSDLEDTIINGTDGMDGLTAAYDIFGKSGDQIYAAVKNGTVSFKDLALASLDAGGSVSETFESTLDPVDEFKIAMQGLQVTGAEVGTSLLSTLTPAIEKIAEVIKTISDWWTNLSPQTQEMIIKIGMIVAVIGPMLSMGGRLLIGIGQLMTFLPVIAGVMSGTVIPAIVGVVTALGPIVLAIGAVIAIGVLLHKHWDEISAFAIETWEKIKEKVSVLIENLKTKISTAWENIKTKVATVVNNIKTTLTTVWTNIKTTISTTIDSIKTKISTVFDGIKTKITTVWTNIKTSVTATVTSIKTTIANIWTNLKTSVSTTVTAIKTKVSSVFTSLKTSVTTVWNGIKSAITSPIETAKSLVSSAVSTIKNLFPISMGKIFSGIQLPHFHISGGQVPWGIGGKGVKPSVSVEWYRKAMDSGMLLDGATIFGARGNELLGGGEAGKEWIVGQNSLMGMIQAAVGQQAAVNNQAISAAIAAGLARATIPVYMDGKDVTGIVNQHNTTQQMNRLRMQGI